MMKQMKSIPAILLAAAAFAAALGAGSASATTMEVEGVPRNNSVSLRFKIDLGRSTILKDTFGTSSNTCTESRISGSTQSPFTGATVTAWVSSMYFAGCTRTVTVHSGGTLHVAYTSGTNGTVSSSGAEITTGSPFGTLNCKTGFGTHLGTLTGTPWGWSTLDVNAALNCSGISSKWEGTYSTVFAEGLGVVA